MTDYAANDLFLDFLEKELLPQLGKRYRISADSADRAILGASMGGLIATYAVLKRPEFIMNCCAQSPAYYQSDSTVLKIVDTLAATRGKFYIQTGTVNDTRMEALFVEKKLRALGALVKYEEFHEGHNWTNWKTHLPKMLERFFRP